VVYWLEQICQINFIVSIEDNWLWQDQFVCYFEGGNVVGGLSFHGSRPVELLPLVEEKHGSRS
jgi:hypothetical protein